jgi:tetratricopeptide (TPR) repeat protein
MLSVARVVAPSRTVKTMKDGSTYQEHDAWQLLAKYFRHPAVMLSTLALATAVLYNGTLTFEFVWDDGQQIVDNPLIRSWHNVSRAFVSDLWYHTARQQVYYRPLFIVWSILNYAVVGLRPWGWHLGAILLHVGATLTVFWLARRLGLEYWTAALATLIFALHPIHIESVAWISAAADSMVTMFTALAFAAFLNARDPEHTQRFAWRVVSMVLLACALLTKEMAACFAPLVACYVWLFPSRKQMSVIQKCWEVAVNTIPYGVLTIGYMIVRKLALRNSPMLFDPRYSCGDMFATLPYVVLFYLRKLIVPQGLTGLYYTPYVMSDYLVKFVLPLALLVGVAALIYHWARKTNDWLVLFAGLWLLVGLAPALYLRNFWNSDFVRDRYIYLPSIGFAILLAIAVRSLPAFKTSTAGAVQGFAAVVLCGAYVVASVPQQAWWDSDLLVYMRGHELYPENALATIGLGREYSRRGAHERAIALLEDAARRDRNSTFSLLGLAEVYIAAGRNEEGRKTLEQAVRASPEYFKSETGMANLAALWGKLGDYDRSRALCDRTLASDPNLYSALYNCGNVELMAGHYSPAEQLLARAVQNSPQLAAPRHFLGRALLLDGKNVEGQRFLQQAAAIDPQVSDYHYWLGRSLEESGNKSGAREEYQLALQLNESSAEAKLRLTALEAK